MPRQSKSATPTTPQDRLVAALADMDRAFGPRTGNIGPVDSCTHCFEPKYLQILGGPVDAIPDWLFARALGKWGTTVDADPVLWRRFTPRILRRMTDGTLHIAEGLIARKFNEADWRNWPDGERAALEEVCDAWWQTVLTTYPGPSATMVLEFVVLLTGRVEDWLDRWEVTTDRSAAAQLHDTWHTWRPELLAGRLNINYFGETVDIAPQMTAWFLRQDALSLAEAEFDDEDRYALAQLALPDDQRWRLTPHP